jgi:dephospho-CoA kinase
VDQPSSEGVAVKALTRYHAAVGPEFSKIFQDWEMPFLKLQRVPTLIGVVGTWKAGKTTVAKHLVTEKSFHYESLSQRLRETSRMTGIGEPAWTRVADLATKWREDEGNAVLADLFLRKLREAGVLARQTRIVIDDIMHTDEIALLCSLPNFYLIGIDADQDLRRRRLTDATGNTMPFEDFVARDNWERGLVAEGSVRADSAPNVDVCLQLVPADCKFDSGTEQHLFFPALDHTLHRILALDKSLCPLAVLAARS